MRKTIVLIAIILIGCFINFHSDSGMVVEWGIYYVASKGIRDNGNFTIDRNPTPTGTWKLKDNESKIIFYTQVTDNWNAIKRHYRIQNIDR